MAENDIQLSTKQIPQHSLTATTKPKRGDIKCRAAPRLYITPRSWHTILPKCKFHLSCC